LRQSALSERCTIHLKPGGAVPVPFPGPFGFGWTGTVRLQPAPVFGVLGERDTRPFRGPARNRASVRLFLIQRIDEIHMTSQQPLADVPTGVAIYVAPHATVVATSHIRSRIRRNRGTKRDWHTPLLNGWGFLTMTPLSNRRSNIRISFARSSPRCPHHNRTITHRHQLQTRPFADLRHLLGTED
jgi:hypothetical protein